jgi:hypothetical protein
MLKIPFQDNVSIENAISCLMMLLEPMRDINNSIQNAITVSCRNALKVKNELQLYK